MPVRFPLEAQAARHAKRRIGLGVTGLADALAMIGLRYGSPEAGTDRDLDAQDRQRRLSRLGDLAKEKGSVPAFDAAEVRSHLAPCRRWTKACRRHRGTWHAQRAPDLDRADRHDQPLCRQRVLRDRAHFRL
jgi:ribonucleotide reductase alpha subunit